MFYLPLSPYLSLLHGVAQISRPPAVSSPSLGAGAQVLLWWSVILRHAYKCPYADCLWSAKHVARYWCWYVNHALVALWWTWHGCDALCQLGGTLSVRTLIWRYEFRNVLWTIVHRYNGQVLPDLNPLPIELRFPFSQLYFAECIDHWTPDWDLEPCLCRNSQQISQDCMASNYLEFPRCIAQVIT